MHHLVPISRHCSAPEVRWFWVLLPPPSPTPRSLLQAHVNIAQRHSRKHEHFPMIRLTLCPGYQGLGVLWGPLAAGAETQVLWPSADFGWSSGLLSSLQPENATDFTIAGGMVSSVLVSLQLKLTSKMHCCNRSLKLFPFYNSKGFLMSFCVVSRQWLDIYTWALLLIFHYLLGSRSAPCYTFF